VFAVSAVALLLLAASVAFAATGVFRSAQTATAASKPAAAHQAAAAIRPLRYACARNLYNAKKVLTFVSRPSQCRGTGKTLITFARDFPVETCRKEHGGFAARQRRFQFPSGIRSHGPAGLMRLVNDLSQCAPNSQPNETPIELPRPTPRTFCAAKVSGELRWVNSASACDHKEFPVLLAAASNSGDPVARNDTATTDENHSTSINVLANDRNTGTSNSNAGLQVASTDTTGTKGTVTVNANDTITYDPAGHFESLKAGQTATDTFKYRAKKGAHTSAPATVTVTITGVNDAPVAGNDSATTDSGHSASIAVLTNDTDADGDSLSVASVDTTGTHGTVTKNGDGTVTYNPNHQFDSLAPGESAHDTFTYKANDGHVDSNSATVDVTVTGQDDPPVVTTTSGSTAYTESAPSVVVDGGLTVTDPDTANLESARVQISPDTFQSGDVLDFTSPGPGGIQGFYDGGTGVLSLTGHASKADWQAALRSVKFRSDNDNPATPKVIQFTANDGNSDSQPATKQVAVTNVNDPPSVTTSGGMSSFTENSPPTQVDPAITVDDPDSLQFQGAKVQVTTNFSSADGDTLGFSNQNGITGSYNAATGLLTLSGNASMSDYQNALASITFSNTSDTPSTATRTVSFQVTDDSGAPSNLATKDVGVTPTNDPPVVTTTAGSTSVAEDATATIDSGVTVADPDDTNIESAQVRVSSGFQTGDSLVFTNTPNISGAYTAGTGVLTLTGTDTKANYQAALRSVQFTTSNNNPTPSKTIEFKANDGDADSNLATKTMSVSNVNDAPSVDLNGSANPGVDTTASFTEDSPAASVAPSADVADPDNTSLQSATITLTNHPDGATESLSVTTAGTSITASAYNSGTGVLTLSGSDTVAHYQQVIRSLKYDNSSNTPNTTARVINVKVNDGGLDSNEPHSTVSVTAHNDPPTATDQSVSTNEDTALAVTLSGTDPEGDTLTFSYSQPAHGSVTGLAPGVTYTPNPDYCGPDSFDFTVDDGNGGTDTGTISITVNCVNDAPVVDLNGNSTAGSDATASFTENFAPASVAPSADISDVDSANLASATITLTNHPDGANETLSVTTAGTGITASAYNSGTGVLALSGSDTVANYQQVIRSLKYSNSSDTPDTTDRVINVKVNDGALDSNEPHSTVSITATNDPPAADNQSTSATEDTAKGITLTGSDPDNDPITFHSDQPAHGSVSPTTGSSVTYTPNPDYCGPDSFTFHTNDGTVDSANGTVSITVTCVNDAPVTDLNGTGTAGFDTSASFVEDAGAVNVAPAADITDSDSATLASATLTLTNRPDTTFESLSVNIPGGNPITASSYTNATGTITLTGNGATVAQFQTVIRSLKYANSSNNPGTANRLVTVKVNDGSLDSNIATSTVSVTPTNDPPTATDQSGLTTNEDTALPITLSGTDPEGDSLTFTHDSTSAQGGTIVGSGSSVTYTPAQDYCNNPPGTSPDSFGFAVDDGNGGTDTGTISITVNCVNDAPVADLNGTGTAGTDSTSTFLEAGATPVAVAPNADVTDVDTANMASATITLTNRPDGNAFESLSIDTSGTSIVASSYDSASGVITLTGSAPKGDYSTVLRTLKYNNTKTAPNPTDRSITVVVNDGALDSATSTAKVKVVPINAPPVVDLNGTGTLGLDTTASFTEDSGPTILAPSADVTDADNANLASATITITNHPDGGAESLLADVTGTSITADAYAPATGVLFLHGTDTVAHYQQVIRNVAYNNTSNTPSTTNRSIAFKVNDGQDDSNIATADTTVTAHNDAPTATDQSVSTNEDTAKGITLSGTDPEGDSLTFTYDSTSAQGGTISGTAPNVTYTPPTNYSGPDSFNFTADDGNGGTDSGTISITVVPVNDAPVLDLNGAGAGIDNNAAFTENQPGVQLAPSATASDVDSANLTSATVVLVNHPDNAAEVLTATPGGSITVDTYDSSTGVLFLHGSDTLAHYQQVLRSVVYNNTSDTPDSSPRQIHWKVNDGSLDSATATTTLTVTPVNDPPTLDLNGAGAGLNETASYTEDQPATTLAPNEVTSDPDSTNLQSATVTLTNHPDGANETLSVDTSGTSITATAYNPTTGVLSLSGSDTVAAYQQVLRTVKYVNASQNADATNRTVNFVVSDGTDNSNSPTVSVTITVVNDPPVVDMNGGGGGIDSSAAFTEDSSPTVTGSGPVNLGASATVSDVDNGTLNSATLTVTNHPDGASESLSVNLAGTPITTGGYNSSTGVLQLTGNGATTAQFQSVIQSAQYNNVSNTPDPTDRDITIKVNDGAADSTVAHTTVSVTPTNDAPTATSKSFTAGNSAVGNTTFVLNDPTDGAPTTQDPTDTSTASDPRPHKTINSSVLTGSTDPEGNTITVASAGTAGSGGTNGSTEDGGTVTVQSDGDIVVEPKASTSCTDHSDSFTYKVQDNGSPAGTSTSTVSFDIAGCAWYVDNADSGGNSGTSAQPFDTLAQAESNSSAGDSIYVYKGDGTTGGQTTGIDLKANQQLIGQAGTLTVGSDTLQTGDSTKRPLITDSTSNVVNLAANDVLKGLQLDPQGGGGISGGSGDASGTIDDVKVIDTGTAGTAPGLDLSSTSGTYNISNLTVDNSGATTPTSADSGVNLNNAGTVNFASSGTISIKTSGAPGLTATNGAGTTSFGAGSVFDDITVALSGTGGVSLNGTTGTVTLGDGAGTDLDLTTSSGATPALNIVNAGSVSVPSAGVSNLDATGGAALNITGTSGATLALDAVSSTNSASQGINISGLGAGTFTAASGSLGGYTGTGFVLNGGTGTITYPGTFNNGAGDTANISNRGASAGAVTLNGNINDSNDAGGGIAVSNNTSGNIVFGGSTKTLNTGASDAITSSFPDTSTASLIFSNGGLGVTTTSGKGYEATGVGPTADGNVQISGSGNTIDTGAGKSLNVSNANVNATGLTLQRISGNGANAGILLNNTGSNNALTVAGNSGTCTAADQSGCSGGTIQNTSGSDDSGTTPVGTAVVLNNTKGVSLTREHITNNSNYGIRGDSVTGGFSLNNSVVDGTEGTEAPASAGSPFNESAVRFTELTGSSNNISSSAISGGATDNVGVINSAGTLNRLTIQSDTFGNNSNTQGNRAIDVVGTGTATTNVTVDSSTFTASRSHDFGLDNTGAGADVVFTNNTMSNSRPATGPNAQAGATGNVKITSGASSAVTLNVSNNNMTGADGNAMLFVHDVGGGSLAGTVNNNQIGTAGTANSGSIEGDGIQLNETGGTAGSSTSLAITNNQIRQYNNFGIELASGSSGFAGETGNISATVTGNTISNPGNNASISSIFQGIQLNTATVDGQSFQWCLNLKGNSIVGSGRNGGTDFRLRQRFDTSVRIPGYGGTAFDTAAITAFEQNQNDGNPNSPAAEPPTPTGASLTDAPSGGSGFTGGAACASG
jgi:hypothetical protein